MSNCLPCFSVLWHIPQASAPTKLFVFLSCPKEYPTRMAKTRNDMRDSLLNIFSSMFFISIDNIQKKREFITQNNVYELSSDYLIKIFDLS
jgi:hypothetical protein